MFENSYPKFACISKNNKWLRMLCDERISATISIQDDFAL